MRLTKEILSSISEDIIKKKLIYSLIESIPIDVLDKLFSTTVYNPELDENKELMATPIEYLTLNQKMEREKLLHLLQSGTIEYKVEIDI